MGVGVGCTALMQSLDFCTDCKIRRCSVIPVFQIQTEIQCSVYVGYLVLASKDFGLV